MRLQQPASRRRQRRTERLTATQQTTLAQSQQAAVMVYVCRTGKDRAGKKRTHNAAGVPGVGIPGPPEPVADLVVLPVAAGPRVHHVLLNACHGLRRIRGGSIRRRTAGCRRSRMDGGAHPSLAQPRQGLEAAGSARGNGMSSVQIVFSPGTARGAPVMDPAPVSPARNACAPAQPRQPPGLHPDFTAAGGACCTGDRTYDTGQRVAPGAPGARSRAGRSRCAGRPGRSRTRPAPPGRSGFPRCRCTPAVVDRTGDRF